MKDRVPDILFLVVGVSIWSWLEGILLNEGIKKAGGTEYATYYSVSLQSYGV